MQLMTKEIQKRMEKYPLYSQDGKGLEAEVIVKFFAPVGAATWLITEAQEEDGDILMFGYITLGDEWEWGYVSFNELKSITLPLGLKIERDLYVKQGTKVKDLI